MIVHPSIAAGLAAEHIKDMRRQAAAARRAKLARRARRGPATALAALQVSPVRDRSGLGTAPSVQLHQDVRDIHAGRLRREEQLRRDLPVAEAARELMDCSA